MTYVPSKIKAALIIAITTFILDFLFHKTLTEPMESFDYFTIKLLLAFFIATFFVNWPRQNWKWMIVFASITSFLMSLYYRWWEFSVGVSYGERAPDIIFLDRTQAVLFGGTWFLSHAIFFVIGILISKKIIRNL